jgi:hypothetical protein
MQLLLSHTLPTGAFAPNVTKLGRWRYFGEFPFHALR